MDLDEVLETAGPRFRHPERHVWGLVGLATSALSLDKPTIAAEAHGTGRRCGETIGPCLAPKPESRWAWFTPWIAFFLPGWMCPQSAGHYAVDRSGNVDGHTVMSSRASTCNEAVEEVECNGMG